MNCCYDDILREMKFMGKEPIWFDENAVPRFCDFHPEQCSNIYAKEACLLEIECQACERKFLVCLSSFLNTSIGHFIETRMLEYGDPPNVDCCAAGPTMTSNAKRVHEFWRKNKDTNYEWKRFHELEVDLLSEVPE